MKRSYPPPNTMNGATLPFPYLRRDWVHDGCRWCGSNDCTHNQNNCPALRCSHCGDNSHRMKNCPYKGLPQHERCALCNLFGHKKKNCALTLWRASLMGSENPHTVEVAAQNAESKKSKKQRKIKRSSNNKYEIISGKGNRKFGAGNLERRSSVSYGSSPSYSSTSTSSPRSRGNCPSYVSCIVCNRRGHTCCSGSTHFQNQNDLL